MNGVELPPLTWAGVSIGLVVLVAGLLASLLVRAVVRLVLRWTGRGPSASTVFSRLAGWVIALLSVLAALTIVFPSVKPVDILGGVGVVSIAAGIAFQTVLGNMFAGIVLLARDRYRIGDQIAVQEHRGTIVAMALTSTSLRTFDGRLVLIPNAVLHSHVVTVQTGFERVRTSVHLDVDDSVDLRRACRLATETMLAVPQVLDQPAPQALLTEVGTTTVRIELRFWSGATQLETRETIHEVIAEVLAAFSQQEVATGSDVVVIEAGDRLAGLLGEDGTPSER
ncbi:mechanosensitive ion channel family protein [Brachybacterium vulturis]|uniref:mechanosensitive ion channel family protein n=1 Tax=Brachybacterium vulturis TaxID=2017484 RepID=UPI0037357E77